MRLLKVVALGLLPFLLQCKTPDVLPDSGSQIKSDETYAASGVESLPRLTDAEALVPMVKKALKSRHLSDADQTAYSSRIAHYLAFLGLTPADPKTPKVLSRLLGGSTQFLLCDTFADWECLEKQPVIVPSSDMRVDAVEGLGDPVAVDGPLKIEAHFTDQWDRKLDDTDPDDRREVVDWSDMLSLKLAEKIKAKGMAGISVAIYGIDKIEGSMKPVYDALTEKAKSGVPIRAVFDSLGLYVIPRAHKPTFSYRRPMAPATWAFDKADTRKTNVAFLYDGTASLLNFLNEGIASEEESKARVEWPNSGIMHNKFLVLDEGGGKRGVWTGTANVADSCMGAERNSNVGIYIDNTEVADTFQTEFEEMYTFRKKPDGTPELHVDDKVLNGSGQPGIPIGSFHGKKRPNTKRYFKFRDGNEMRVHFAPTDDGEHRAILPMLLSAKRGDTVRIAMFGAAGIELVRAMQAAVARGVNIRMVLDCATGSQTAGTIRDKDGNLLDINPYLNAEGEGAGSLVIRRSTEKMNLNHHKSATLTRGTGRGRPEVIIIGSQNWSASGNDKNDENMVTIRSLEGEVPIGRDYNVHFDTRLWPASEIGELKPGIPYDRQNKCDGGAPEGDDTEGGEGEGEGEGVTPVPTPVP